MTRERLPNRRHSETLSMQLDGITYDVTIGCYEDGRVGEVFCHGAKIGSDTQCLLDDACVLLSVLFQHGADPADLLSAMGEPPTVIGLVLDAIVAGLGGNGR